MNAANLTERRSLWELSPDLDFLNHGSFGATPKPVLQSRLEMIEQLERDPIEFLAPERRLLSALDAVRAEVADLVGADAESIVFVKNATDGVNAVLRSFPLRRGEEVVITDHGYNACNNAVRSACQSVGATVRVAEIPFESVNEERVFECIERVIHSKTRLLVIDHITSPTALIFPLKRLVELSQSRGVRVLVDGAHAPGMIDINLRKLGADYYTGNHHKWWCAPKASGFLYVDPRWQTEVRPTVISHGANQVPPGRSRFHAEFDWVGTYDPTPLLTLPSAIQFLRCLFPGGLGELMSRNREKAFEARRILADAFSIDSLVPDSMIGSMASVPLLHSDRLDGLQGFLRERRIEVPVFHWCGRSLIRVSLQAYNSLDQVERLAELTKDWLSRR
ncbi:MAG: aminotransferase class V-fold PLP-dependent enzyme [Planctomycetota bacterium]